MIVKCYEVSMKIIKICVCDYSEKSQKINKAKCNSYRFWREVRIFIMYVIALGFTQEATIFISIQVCILLITFFFSEIRKNNCKSLKNYHCIKSNEYYFKRQYVFNLSIICQKKFLLSER